MNFGKDAFTNYYILISIIGVLVLIVGLKFGGIYSTLIATLGGSIIGSCVSLIFDVIKKNQTDERSRDLMEEMRDIIKDSFHENPIRSDESDIRIFKQKFYLYYLTTSKEGNIFWNSCLLDFSKRNGIGVLKAKSTIQDYYGNPYEYEFEGFKRGRDHPFGVIHYAVTLKGQEKNGQYIFPIYDGLEEPRYYGFQYHYNWGKREAVSPAILMKKMPPDCNGLGRVNHKVASYLQQEWDKNFENSVWCFKKYPLNNEETGNR